MAQAPYRFVGVSKSGIFGTKYEMSRFGQQFAIDPDVIEPLIGGLDVNGAPYGGFLAIPESVWASCNISEAELKAHGGKIIQGREPDDFRLKKEAAWAAHDDYVKSKHATPEIPVAAVVAATAEEK